MIDNGDGRRGRKINDGVRKGMPLRRLAALIDFPDSAEVSIPVAIKRIGDRGVDCISHRFAQELKLKF